MDEDEQSRQPERRRELRHGQFSLRTLMGLVSGASILVSAFTVPGVGGVLLVLFAGFAPALIALGLLLALQLPLMLLAGYWSRENRRRHREERRALSVLKRRSSG